MTAIIRVQPAVDRRRTPRLSPSDPLEFDLLAAIAAAERAELERAGVESVH